MQLRNKATLLPLLLAALLAPLALPACAQMGPMGPGFSGSGCAGSGFAGPGFAGSGFSGPGSPPMERAFGPHHGRWWDNPDLAQKIGLTDQQRHQMDDTFQQHRLRLIDLNANLQKQEAILQPLVEADQPEETKILAQIDAVAQARAELEKAHARMLLGIRRVLTPDQWKKLQAMHEERHHGWDRDDRGPRRDFGQRQDFGQRRDRSAPPSDAGAPPDSAPPPAAPPQ